MTREHQGRGIAGRSTLTESWAQPAAVVGKRTLTEAIAFDQPRVAHAATPARAAPVQHRAANSDAGGHDSAAVHASAQRGIATAASPLPHAETIQRLFGRHDISGIKAHTGTDAATSAGEMGADAYATGNHVVLGGRADLHTAAHEAAHVVQQRAGVHLAGGVGQAGDPHEHHADAVADRVVQGRSAEDLLDAYGGTGGAPVVQKREVDRNFYARYDPDAKRSPTKALIEAGHREDEAEKLRAAAVAHQLRVQSHAADPMVATLAAAKLDDVIRDAAAVARAKQLITIWVNLIEKAYSAALDPTIIARCTPKSQKRDDKLSAFNACNEQDARITEKTTELISRVSVDLDGAKAAATRIRVIVAQLDQEADRQRKGEKDYTQNVTARNDANDAKLSERATDLGVAESPDIARLYEQARVHSEANEWTKAGTRSGEGRVQLEALDREVKKAERDRDAYETLRATLKLKPIRDAFEGLKIQKGPLTDAEDLVADARTAYGKKQWRTALSLAKQAEAKLPELNDLVTQFDAYRDGAQPKLLPGTILDVHGALAAAHGAYTNAQALVALEATYRDQCAVTRFNWLEHLHIAGANVKIGSDADHYTTFNDSIPAIPSLSVDGHNVAALCAALFAAVVSTQQIHATRVVGAERYHRYWDGTYSANVAANNLAGVNPVAHAALDARYDAMVHDMTEGVRAAKAAHGRVWDNRLGRQITIRLV